MSDEEVTAAEVLEHMTVVAHRVASAIARELPEAERAAAVAAAERVLVDDEGARELLSAAYDEGRADAIRAALRSGTVPEAPDFSDVESEGERRAIAREESVCGSCSAADVCGVALAVKQIGALVVLKRCERHR